MCVEEMHASEWGNYGKARSVGFTNGLNEWIEWIQHMRILAAEGNRRGTLLLVVLVVG